MNGTPSIEARGIVKRFGALVANDRIDLSALPGEVLAVVGENGAGKSTLMNMLSGLLRPDEGEILVKGERVRFRSPRDAIERGIGMVHQHFMLIPKLTVAQNVVLGHEPSRVLYDAAAARRKVAELSDSHGLKLDPDARVESLSVGLQQRVEILKVLYWGSDILILDEPTAVLTPQETSDLFTVVRDLTRQGRTIVFITHKLKEVMAISDRITVLRQGRVEGSLVTAETSPPEIAGRMLGRDLVPRSYSPPVAVGETVLQIQNLEVQSDRGLPAVRGLDLEVRSGEIVGIAGVEGNGQTELVEALAGLRTPTAGSVTVLGKNVFSKGKLLETGPARVRASGVGSVPEDRRERGLVLAYSVSDNLILGLEDRALFSRFGLLAFGSIRRWALDLVKRFNVRPERITIPVGNLSGGNQQKVVLAREFSEEPPLLIVSQPTRGLDVGAAQFVHERLVEKRDANTAILLVSAELDEVMALSDRLAVLYEGQIMRIFKAGEATDQEIGLLMAGGVERTAEISIDLAAPGLAAAES